MNCEGVPLVGIPNHPNWFIFARKIDSASDSPRVIIYVNVRLFSFWFSLLKDIINHKDILLASFLNNNDIFWIMNIYSNSSHSALKYLKDTEVNISNLLIMTGDFNIRDSIWNPSFPHYSFISDDLIIIADSFNLDLSIPTNQIHTRYSDIVSKLNSVIDLMFLQSSFTKLNNHFIYPNWRISLDHAPLTVSILITKENIISSKFSIMKNSKEETAFIKDISYAIKNLGISNLSNINKLEDIVNSLASNIESVWRTNSKHINITRHSKS